MTNGDDTSAGNSQVEAVQPEPEEPTSNRWRVLAIVLGGLVLILVIVVVVLLASDNGDNNSVNTSATSTSTTVTTTTTLPTTSTAPPTTSGHPATTSAPPTTSGGGTTPTTATTATPAVVITSFTVSPTTIACPSSDVSTSLPAPTVTLNWTTQNASSVDVLVDGGLYSPNLGPSGSTTINIPCDGSTHTYGVTAHGTHGGTATKTLSVTTHT